MAWMFTDKTHQPFSLIVRQWIARLSDLSTSVFLKKLTSFSPFLSSLVSMHLPIGYLRTDVSGIAQASLFHLILISPSFTLVSFMPIFILFDLQVSMNK